MNKDPPAGYIEFTEREDDETRAHFKRLLMAVGANLDQLDRATVQALWQLYKKAALATYPPFTPERVQALLIKVDSRKSISRSLRKDIDDALHQLLRYLFF